jgi:hypothetical protein
LTYKQTYPANAFQVEKVGTWPFLIVSGKLTEDWETGLKRVTIDIRKSKDKREYVVNFEKSKGEPNSVYFFFDKEGQYSGSNFTGK